MSAQAQVLRPQQKTQPPPLVPQPAPETSPTLSIYLEKMAKEGSEAIGILKRLIEDTSAIMGGGSKSKDRCLACVSKGVHNTVPRRCQCSCHEARELLKRLEAQE